MAMDDPEPAAHEDAVDDPDDYITFPYPVATVRGTGWCLRAFFKHQCWQWVWYGAYTYCLL